MEWKRLNHRGQTVPLGHFRNEGDMEEKAMKTLTPEMIEEIVRRVTTAVHPLRVVLFGSAARGEMGPRSDIDLLIVVPDGTHRRDASRKAFIALSGLGIAKDVIVVTESDVKQFGKNPSLVIKPALEEGREVYRVSG